MPRGRPFLSPSSGFGLSINEPPEGGDTCNALAAKFPGSTLGETLRPVPRSDGTTDLYIVTERFRAQFCADVPAPEAARMAVTQRPPTLEALTEPSGGVAAGKFGGGRWGSCGSHDVGACPVHEHRV